MKGLLCNIVRVPVNSGAISLNGNSFRDVIFTALVENENGGE